MVKRDSIGKLWNLIENILKVIQFYISYSLKHVLLTIMAIKAKLKKGGKQIKKMNSKEW